MNSIELSKNIKIQIKTCYRGAREILMAGEMSDLVYDLYGLIEKHYDQVHSEGHAALKKERDRADYLYKTAIYLIEQNCPTIALEIKLKEKIK